MGKEELRLIDVNVLKARARDVLNDGTPTTISLLKIFDSIVDSVKPLNYIDHVTVDFSDLTEEQKQKLYTAFSKSTTHVIARNDFENVERPTGHWFLLDECSNEGVYCSNCHKKVYRVEYANQKVKSNYCPNCGADMRGGRE